MLQFYRTANCAGCAEIEAALQEMVIAHKIITVTSEKPPESLPANTSLPAIRDNGQIISGPEAIATYLKELAKFVADWRRFQSDACYLDDEGEVC